MGCPDIGMISSAPLFINSYHDIEILKMMSNVQVHHIQLIIDVLITIVCKVEVEDPEDDTSNVQVDHWS